MHLQTPAKPPFAERLQSAIQRVGNPILLGVDPHLELLPPEFEGARDKRLPRRNRAELVERFCLELIDLAAGRVPAIKPQAAFFEELGSDGYRAFEQVIAHAHSAGLLVVADVKRGDIASTAEAYARGLFEPQDPHFAADAVTLSPYLGPDSLDPWVKACDRVQGGAFVLVRTSNPGGTAWQTAGEPSPAARVAAELVRINAGRRGPAGFGPFGAVVGATQRAELEHWRAALPDSFLLLPGYGAQGATARDVAPAFLPGARGALVASSRGIAFAYRDAPGSDWRQAAASALERMHADLTAALR
jgi:orotidine-5'-phosphate decarboxylase